MKCNENLPPRDGEFEAIAQFTNLPVPAALVYADKKVLTAKEKAHRIKMMILDVFDSAGSYKNAEVGALLEISESTAKRLVRKLRKLGLCGRAAVSEKNFEGLLALRPHRRFMPASRARKSPKGWFHPVPRLLILTLGPIELLGYLHLRHKSLDFWTKQEGQRSSHAEIADAVGVNRDAAAAAVKELESLGIIDWAEGRFSWKGVQGLSMENLDLMRGHEWLHDEDLVQLQMLGRRNHSFDLVTADWAERFGPAGPDQDGAGRTREGSFWGTLGGSAGVKMGHPQFVLCDATGVSHVGTYVDMGLRPAWGNKDTKRNEGTERDQRVGPSSGRGDVLLSLFPEVPPFVGRGFLEFAARDRAAAAFLSIWFDSLHGKGPRQRDIREGHPHGPYHYAENGKDLAGLLLDVMAEAGIADEQVGRGVAALGVIYRHRKVKTIDADQLRRDLDDEATGAALRDLVGRRSTCETWSRPCSYPSCLVAGLGDCVRSGSEFRRSPEGLLPPQKFDLDALGFIPKRVLQESAWSKRCRDELLHLVRANARHDRPEAPQALAHEIGAFNFDHITKWKAKGWICFFDLACRARGMRYYYAEGTIRSIAITGSPPSSAQKKTMEFVSHCLTTKLGGDNLDARRTFAEIFIAGILPAWALARFEHGSTREKTFNPSYFLTIFEDLEPAFDRRIPDRQKEERNDREMQEWSREVRRRKEEARKREEQARPVEPAPPPAREENLMDYYVRMSEERLKGEVVD